MGFLRLYKEEVDPEGAAEVQEHWSLGPSEVLADIFFQFYNPIRSGVFDFPAGVAH